MSIVYMPLPTIIFTNIYTQVILICIAIHSFRHLLRLIYFVYFVDDEYIFTRITSISSFTCV